MLSIGERQVVLVCFEDSFVEEVAHPAVASVVPETSTLPSNGDKTVHLLKLDLFRPHLEVWLLGTGGDVDSQVFEFAVVWKV